MFFIGFFTRGGGNIYADELESSLAKEADSKVAVFVGGEVGYGVAFLSATNNSANGGKTTELRAPYGVVGGKIGIKKLFGEKQVVGLRGYVSYHYSNDGEYSSHQTAFNTEAVFNIGKRVGIYAGLGAGYVSNVAISSNNFANGTTTPNNQTTLINDPKGSGFILPVNVGFEVALNAHHFVNFNVRAPSIAASERLGEKAESSTTYSARNLLLTLGYTYQF